FLTRHLKQAAIVRVPRSDQVVETMLREGITVGAGVRQQLEAAARRTDGVRRVEGSFMATRQACAMQADRSAAARGHLDAFVERMKASGYVAEALARHGIEGAAVAPAR